MFATVIHVLLFVVAIIGLLAIKQRRLRHIPNRRTHIPRRNAEGTLWLQRAVNAGLDMLHCALAEQSGNSSTSATHEPRNPINAERSNADASKKSSAAPGDDSASESSAEVVSDLPFLNTLKTQLEEQISALLEDKGIASFADFRIKDWGGKPPVVKAVCLSHGGGGAGLSGSSVNTANVLNSNNSINNTNVNNGVNLIPGSGVGGNNSNNNNLDASFGGQRGGGGSTQGQSVGNPSTLSASVAGSPSGLGPLHYPPSGSGLPFSSTAGGRSGPFTSSPSFSGLNSHPHTSPLPPPGERSLNDPQLSASVDAPYASASLRYRAGSAAAAAAGNHGGVGSGVNGASASAGGSVLNANNNTNSNISMNGVGMDDGMGRERSLAGSMLHPSRGVHQTSMSSADLASGLGASGAPNSGVGSGGSGSAVAGTKNATDTTRSLSVLEAEVEVEYTGNFNVSLNADIPIARGRYLQVYAAIHDVRMLAAHLRLRLSLEYEPATVESPQPQPFLRGRLWLLSDPVFDVAFHSTLTQYRIRDFFLIPKLIKFFLLRFLRNKLRPASSGSAAAAAAAASTAAAASGTAAGRHANARRRRPNAGSGGGSGGAGGGGGGTAEEVSGDGDVSDLSGLSFRIQLPADVVDGGEQWWSCVARDTMSERPAPFLRSYHQ